MDGSGRMVVMGGMGGLWQSSGADWVMTIVGSILLL